MTNEETTRQLVAEEEAKYLKEINAVGLPLHLVARGIELIEKAKQLDVLMQANHNREMADRPRTATEEADKQEAMKKPKKGLIAQTYFAADGPALFMEGPRRNHPKVLEGGLAGVSRKQRVWKQSREYVERTPSRILRARKSGRGTTKSARV